MVRLKVPELHTGAELYDNVPRLVILSFLIV